jgi:hypothetical protein
MIKRFYLLAVLVLLWLAMTASAQNNDGVVTLELPKDVAKNLAKLDIAEPSKPELPEQATIASPPIMDHYANGDMAAIVADELGIMFISTFLLQQSQACLPHDHRAVASQTLTAPKIFGHASEPLHSIKTTSYRVTPASDYILKLSLDKSIEAINTMSTDTLLEFEQVRREDIPNLIAKGCTSERMRRIHENIRRRGFQADLLTPELAVDIMAVPVHIKAKYTAPPTGSVSAPDAETKACVEQLQSKLFSCDTSLDTGGYSWMCFPARAERRNGKWEIRQTSGYPKARVGKCRRRGGASQFDRPDVCDPNTGTWAPDFGTLADKVCN